MSAKWADGPLTLYAKGVWESMPEPAPWALSPLDEAILRENAPEDVPATPADWVTRTAGVPEGVRCPKCRGPMVKRKGSRGKFWGCESYPDCKGTINI